MKKIITVAVAAVSLTAGAGDTVRVNKFRHAGPFPVPVPAVIDSLDVN